MNAFQRLFNRMRGRKQLDLADDTQTELHREAINAFLHKVLSEEEREFIDSYWLSDEAKIFDCSMDTPATWIANCKAAYNLDISNRLRMPLWQLASRVEERAGHGQNTGWCDADAEKWHRGTS